jgi:hypothetical protein
MPAPVVSSFSSFVEEVEEERPLAPGGLEVAREADVEVLDDFREVDRGGAAEVPHGEIDAGPRSPQVRRDRELPATRGREQP